MCVAIINEGCFFHWNWWHIVEMDFSADLGLLLRTWTNSNPGMDRGLLTIDATVGIWEWISNLILNFTVRVITYPPVIAKTLEVLSVRMSFLYVFHQSLTDSFDMTDPCWDHNQCCWRALCRLFYWILRSTSITIKESICSNPDRT